MGKKVSEAGEWRSDAQAPAVNRWTAEGVLLDADSCLMRSEVDEPVFTLCARDPHAVQLVDAWCSLRRIELSHLENEARRVVSISGAALDAEENLQRQRRIREKIADAQSVASAMERWRADHGHK